MICWLLVNPSGKTVVMAATNGVKTDHSHCGKWKTFLLAVGRPGSPEPIVHRTKRSIIILDT